MNIRLTHSVLLLSAMLLLGSVAHAQYALDPSTGGTRYIIAFPDTVTNTYDTRFVHQRFTDGVKVMMYSPVDTRVSITRTNGVTKEYQLQAGVFKIVELTGPSGFPEPIITVRNEIVDNTLQIVSESPIIVYCYMLTGFGCEAWTPLPVESWGKEYYAAAHPGEVGADITPGGENNFNRKNKAFPSEILIIAAYNKTQVSIQPNGTLVDYPPTSVTLNAGQAYLVQCTVDTLLAHIGNPDYQTDLGGTIIHATRPIGVVSGNMRAQLYSELTGLSGNSFKNMLMEWITPAELHGREFVYMPTSDSRNLTGVAQEDLNGKRLSEYVRIYSTDLDSTPGTPTTLQIKNGQDSVATNATTNEHPPGMAGWLFQDRITTFKAHYYRSTGRTQVYMASPGISKNLKPSSGGSFTGATFSAWGGFMTELVPRERWSSFAPYYAPSEPSNMEHYINVATDYADRFNVYKENGAMFNFNQGKIPGTDLCWGTMAVTPGVDHYLVGRNGARFYAVVYGLAAGDDIFRPGVAKKKDNGEQISSRGSNPLEPLMHPAETEERLGLGYAYPLASRINLMQPGDSLKITSLTTPCTCKAYNIQSVNPNPAGFKSISLDADTTLTKNAYIRFFNPDDPTVEIPPLDILGQPKIIVRVCAINEREDARATINIVDRTGKLTQVQYTYKAERVSMDPGIVIDFGNVAFGSSKDTVVTLTNPDLTDLSVKSADLYYQGTNAFTIVNQNPALPTVLANGQNVKVAVRFNPTLKTSFIDTLYLRLGCTSVKVMLKGQTTIPCFHVDDLSFGKVPVNQSSAKVLQLCNNAATGDIRFVAPYVTWDSTRFKISADELDKLKNTVLKPGDCLPITVTFLTPTTGLFKTTARFHTNVNCDRDTSVWSTDSAVAGISFSTAIAPLQLQIIPNPSAESATIRYTLPKHTPAVVTITNVLGQQVLTQRLGTKSPGTQTETIRTATLAPGLYTVVVSDGSGVVYGVGKMGVR